jgi:hypothetical protein
VLEQPAGRAARFFGSTSNGALQVYAPRQPYGSLASRGDDELEGREEVGLVAVLRERGLGLPRSGLSDESSRRDLGDADPVVYVHGVRVRDTGTAVSDTIDACTED